MTVELYLEEISFDKSIYRDTLIFRLQKTFSGDGERNLTLLEVEVSRCEDGNHSFGRICGIEGAVGCGGAVVEVALRHTIEVDNGFRNVRRDIDHNFTIGPNVSLGQVIPQKQNDFNRTRLPHWQFYWTLHRMQLHLLDVTRRFIDDDAFSVSLS